MSERNDLVPRTCSVLWVAVLHYLLLDDCGVVAPAVRSTLVQVALVELGAAVQGAEAPLTGLKASSSAASLDTCSWLALSSSRTF